MIKKTLLYLFIFVVGFLSHAIFFPDFFLSTNQADTRVRKELGLQPKIKTVKEPNPLYVYVSFKNGKFSTKTVTMHRSMYLSVINEDDSELMWLVSAVKAFNTARGFGKSEQLVARLDEPTNFTVAEKNNPTAVLHVTVR